jgi:hypothetical protein
LLVTQNLFRCKAKKNKELEYARKSFGLPFYSPKSKCSFSLQSKRGRQALEVEVLHLQDQTLQVQSLTSNKKFNKLFFKEKNDKKQKQK